MNTELEHLLTRLEEVDRALYHTEEGPDKHSWNLHVEIIRKPISEEAFETLLSIINP